MKKYRFVLSALLIVTTFALQAQQAAIQINSKKADGIIDSKIYGQLFEHIYFSASNGVWQEMVFERSFEPEQYPGIPPRDGYFDGWYADDSSLLHSPTRYEQPIPVVTVEGDSYELSMEVNWRSYLLPSRLWSGGSLDMRFAFKDQANGEPYYFRVFDPQYERKGMIMGMPGGANRERQGNVEQSDKANLSVSIQEETEAEIFGQKRTVKSWKPLKSYEPSAGLDGGGTWHSLRIVVNGSKAQVFWDKKQVLSVKGLDVTNRNNIAFLVNYTEALYRNIRITSPNGKIVYFEGVPDKVKPPLVAHQWNAFGQGTYKLVKGDAVNMSYSQSLASEGKAGIYQENKYVAKGESYIGSIYAKGDGKGTLSVAFKSGDRIVAGQTLGKPGREWTKYPFTLKADDFDGMADFAVLVEKGEVQIDQVTLTSQSGIDLGGFRPDIYQAVKELHPTNLRWPGGGYVAQYNWKWGVGPQEKRQRWANWQWMDYDQNAFGIDEFIRFCRLIQTEPVVVVRVGYERPLSEYPQILQEACELVAYCNEPASGKWGSQRAANGHGEPYNVKYWEIDNEMWEMGIERYEAAVRDFSVAMRKVDPSIKIVACGGFPEDKDLLNRSGRFFDYLSLHHYERADGNGYATGPDRLGKRYADYAQMIANCPNPNIKLYISEWNLQSIDWRTGLFAGGFLNMCEKTPVVEMGAAALFIRRTDAPDWNNAFINFDFKELFVAPNYQVTKLWQEHFSKYRLSYTGDTGGMNVAVTLAENGSAVIVKIVNPTEKACSFTLNGDWAEITGADYSYYAPGSLRAANSMDNKNAVSLKSRLLSPMDNAVSVEVEPLSAGVVKIFL
ncbi:MAG: alpha-L-arabinofuranosidase [Tannerellaceae bacterium]|jgi:alpha-N-arabinofuranosidase|nr:alpha-L-arabinofuranosidase [Tannerellaceae bacterium]